MILNKNLGNDYPIYTNGQTIKFDVNNNNFAFTIDVKFTFTADGSDKYTLNTPELHAYFTGACPFFFIVYLKSTK